MNAVNYKGMNYLLIEVDSLLLGVPEPIAKRILAKDLKALKYPMIVLRTASQRLNAPIKTNSKKGKP